MTAAANNAPSDNQTLVDFLERHFADQMITLQADNGAKENITLLASQQGRRIEDLTPYLEKYRDYPRRRKGTATVKTVESFIEHVNRFKDDNSSIWAHSDYDQSMATLISVLDYHEKEGGLPRFGGHRTQYDFPVSREWEAWREREGEAMGQAEFAEFIELHVMDIAAPPPVENALKDESHPDHTIAKTARALSATFATPAKLMEISRGLKVHITDKMVNAQNISTGEVQIEYTSEHQDGKGQTMKVPNLFLIAIPVFEEGPRYRIPVRLRYRARDGIIKWIFDLYRADMAWKDAVDEACEKVRTETALPLFYGKPE